MTQPPALRFVMEDALDAELVIVNTAIDLKAPKANPIFTGTVTAPLTAGVVQSSAGGVLSSGAIAQSDVTSLVSNLADKAPLDSPVLVTPSLGVATATSINGTLVPTTAGLTLAPTVSPSFTTPTLGAATATTINSTAIPASSTLQTLNFSIGTNTFVSALTAQNLLPVPNDILTMAANTSYFVEGVFSVSVPAASSVAHTMTFTLNGGGAATTGNYVAFTTQNNTSAATAVASTQWLIPATSASAIFPTASIVGTAVYRTVYFKGLIRCTTGGTFIPQITTSAATVAIPAGNASNRISLTLIGSNTVASVGAWA